MTVLSPKLGAAKHFVNKSEDGEADPGNTNYRNIPEQFVGNYSKIEDAKSVLFVMILWRLFWSGR